MMGYNFLFNLGHLPTSYILILPFLNIGLTRLTFEWQTAQAVKDNMRSTSNMDDFMFDFLQKETWLDATKNQIHVRSQHCRIFMDEERQAWAGCVRRLQSCSMKYSADENDVKYDWIASQ